ncbi:MAG: hypothetical protein C5B52_01765 [Bacteroidetes bacterium]|nr:MAG: hypothetical protein C5B52_01765 [Bacteroidota bacterium]
MRKTLSLFTAFLLCGMLVFAQQKTVTGTVTDENGNAVPFATVVVKGQKTGVSADAEGKYSIKVKEGDVLVFSASGLAPKEVSVGSGSIVNVPLVKSSSSTLEEVVVTSAFGIKKAQRVTPFSSQVINSEALNITRQTNVNNALAGKVAGVQTRSQSSAKLGSEAYLRIRGGLGMGDIPPIYVVDGTITSSFDINPDDVEDISVLKGANATALFGGQAVGGAIVVSTRKKMGRQGVGIEVNSGVTADKVYILPHYQNLYGGGSVGDFMQFNWVPGDPEEWKALDGKFFPDYTDDASWGPRMAGQEYIPWYAYYPGSQYSYKTAKWVPQPDNARDFWNTGITSNNNVSFGKSGQGYNFRASYTNQYIKGIIPNSSSMRNTFFITGTMDLNSHFTIGANVNFSSNIIKGEFDDQYANQSSGSFSSWFHRDLDMKLEKSLRNLKSPFGTLATWNLRYNPDGYDPNNPEDFYKANYWYNHYAYFDNIDNTYTRNKFFGDASLTYKINNQFRLKGTVRKNQFNGYYENITKSILEQSGLQTGALGSYSTGNQTLSEYNYELIGTYNQKFGDFNVSALAGGNIYTYKYNDVTANTNNGLNVPGLYAIANSKSNPSIGNTRNYMQTNSVFGQGDLEYKKLASVTFALREDWSSTLTSIKPHLFYPSAGASLVFTELMGGSPSWLSFGKVFGSWGKKPSALGIYQSNFAYGVNQFLWGSNFLMSTPDAYPNPNLVGALSTTIEAGIDLKFIKNRLGLNVVYFDETADKLPVNVKISGVSGFTSTIVNAAKVQRTGIETILMGKAIANKNFSWDISMTFAYLISNPVKEIVEGQNQIPIANNLGTAAGNSSGAFTSRFANAYLVKGEDWGQLIGGGIARNSEGKPIVDPSTGLYLNDVNKKWGSIVPKTTGGVVNTFTYKDFDLSFALDYQIGGKFFSLTEMWGSYSGLLDWTAARNDKGLNVRDEVADGGGVHVIGVSSADQKTPVDMYVDAQTYYHSFYNQQVAEPFVHSLTFVKIRELAVGYRIPVKKIGNMGKYFQGAVFSVLARNPWMIYSESRNIDPSEIVSNFGEESQLPGTRSLGVNLKLIF